MDSLLKMFKRNEMFIFFKSVGVPGGSSELEKGNPGWVPSILQGNDFSSQSKLSFVFPKRSNINLASK